MIRPFVIAFLAALFLAAPASAAQRWSVDYGKSRVGFTVSWSGQPFSATFRSWKADIQFDPADLAHSHAFVTIDTGSEASDDAQTDDGIKGADGFQAAKFPTAEFRASQFRHLGGDRYVANGAVSIKGISRPVALPFTLMISGAKAHVTGKAQLMRTDFHVGTGEWEKPDPVAHAVTVNIDFTAMKA